MSLRGKPSWLMLHTGLYSRWRWREKIRKEGINFDFHFPYSVLLFYLCSVFRKHKQWRYSLSSALCECARSQDKVCCSIGSSR